MTAIYYSKRLQCWFLIYYFAEVPFLRLKYVFFIFQLFRMEIQKGSISNLTIFKIVHLLHRVSSHLQYIWIRRSLIGSFHIVALKKRRTSEVRSYPKPMKEGLILSFFIAGVLFQSDSISASDLWRQLSALPIILKRKIVFGPEFRKQNSSLTIFGSNV